MSLAHQRKLLPGFRLTMGFTIFYLGLVVLLPLAAIFAKAWALSWPQFFHAVASPVARAAYGLSFGASFIAALVNAVFGLLVAWVLVRYKFWGKRVVDALVDLPFALPTAVAGITLATLYSENGWIGRWLLPLGIRVSYTQMGVFIALTFVGMPFVVRTVQPVLEDFDREVEEAASTLGANRLRTFFRVILPMISPAILTGFALAFARALGEYGSVIFISSNIPFRTQIVPVLIMSKLEQFDYAGSAALAVVMLLASFVLLLAINWLQWWSTRHHKTT